MNRKYWEGVGRTYEDEIFASSRADATGLLRRRLDELADPRAAAADFGCGVGHYLPLLARRFREVHGVDFAASLLDQAERRCAGLSNVSLHRADLGSGRARLSFPRVRVAVCANVLISERRAQRENILRAIARHTVPAGKLLLVVPSLESALYVNQRWVEWGEREGQGERAALRSGLTPDWDLMRGLVPIDGVATKHHLREELEVLLGAHGFAPISIEKLEYRWTTEFEHPPRWLARPRPWDWLVIARRTKT